MDAIYIPRLLKAPEKTEGVDFQEHLSALETLTPVQGQVSVTHRGNYLEVVGRAEAIVTLVCDRCLQNYNHRLNVETSELIWLEETADTSEEDPLEKEVSVDEMVETLQPDGYFYPGEWIYEQLCLALPMRQLCDESCSGIQQRDADPAQLNPIDSRWASLAALRENLTN